MTTRQLLKKTSRQALCAILIFLALSLTAMQANAGNYPDTLHVYGNIHIPPNETYQIEAGTVVLFHGYFSIIVEGTLVAAGTPELPVLFTATDTLGLYDTHMAEGGWNGIRFIRQGKEKTEQPSVLNYCILEFSKGSKYDYHNGGAISILGDAMVEITNSTFQHNYAYRRGGAVYLEGNSSPISHCSFYNNQAANLESELWAYGGALFLTASRSEVVWCTFENNYASGLGGAIAIETADPRLTNNIINNNDAPLGGGMGIMRTTIESTFSNNQITQNTSMFFGGGIAFLDASATLINHTISANHSTYGGGLYFNEDSSPVFINSIIYGNTAYEEVPNQVFIWDIYSAPGFYYCNVEGGVEAFEGGNPGETYSGAYVNNTNLPPVFDTLHANPFMLHSNSPCIDAGHPESIQMDIFPLDLLGNERFSGITIDLGAIEYQDPYSYYTMEIIIEGNGSTIPDAGIYTVQEGSFLTLEAFPDEGWAFSHWVLPSANSNENPIEVEIMEPANIAAVFIPATNISELQHSSLKAWPNPAQNHMYVQLPSKSPEIIDVYINDLSGKIKRITYTFWEEQNILLDLSGVSRGLYLLTVISNRGSQTLSFIVN